MLISIKLSSNSAFLGSDKPRMLCFPLINVKMPTTVGILTFMSRKNFMLSSVEHEKSFTISGPDHSNACLRSTLIKVCAYLHALLHCEIKQLHFPEKCDNDYGYPIIRIAPAVSSSVLSSNRVT